MQLIHVFKRKKNIILKIVFYNLILLKQLTHFIYLTHSNPLLKHKKKKQIKIDNNVHLTLGGQQKKKIRKKTKT